MKNDFKPFVADVKPEHFERLKEKEIFLSLAKVYERSWLEKARRVRFDMPVYAERNSGFCSAGGFYNMGAFSYSKSSFRKNVTIGRYCSLGGDIVVMPVNHPMDRLSTSGLDYEGHGFHYHGFQRVRNHTKNADLIIGNDVWIGGEAVLGRNITIGHGAVIGFRSIVTKDVPPYAVVAGTPATVKKMRFDEKTVERLLASEWWNYHPEDICHFDTVNPEKFLDQFEEAKAQGFLRLFTPEKVAVHEIFMPEAEDDQKTTDISLKNTVS